jgi:hypothetical protein
MFRLSARMRDEMLAAGFTDNGGAIHSAERILNILGQRVCCPSLSHINNLRYREDAPFSVAALAENQTSERVLIEHANPHCALTRLVIEQINRPVSDQEFVEFVKSQYQLALLTVAETSRLNK